MKYAKNQKKEAACPTKKMPLRSKERNTLWMFLINQFVFDFNKTQLTLFYTNFLDYKTTNTHNRHCHEKHTQKHTLSQKPSKPLEHFSLLEDN